MMRRFFTVLIAVSAVLLSGCGESSVADRVYGGLPEGINTQPEPGQEEKFAVWIADETRFAIVTWGSSSCPPVATELNVEAEDRLALTFGPSPNDPCAADMASTTYEFALPEGVSDRPVTVTVTYDDWDSTDVLVIE